MDIVVRNRVQRFDTYRTERVRSLFNVEAVKGQEFDLTVDLPIDGDWKIGVVVGPSGSGKTSIGRELVEHAEFDWGGYEWPTDVAIVDAFGLDADFDAVTGALAAVGLGTVPSWLRPYHVLSNGEQFRANMARLVIQAQTGVLGSRVVLDEFTSVLDRQIARIGSMAFAKAWKRTDGQIVLLTPHHDVLPWIQPDWVFDTGNGELVAGSESVQQLVRRQAEDQPRGSRGRVGVLEA